MQTNTKSTNPLAIRRGKITRPQKVVIYGPEGVGKSTLAGQTPEPVFLDTEGGTHHLDVARLDAATTWEEITATVTQLAKADHPFKTLVIDTADWLEKRLAEHLCRKSNKDSIEDFGYGKGWVLLTEEFGRFLNSLDGLLARGIHVVFLAHATVKKFEAPDQAGSYDRFELKLSKQVAPLVKEWADVVLFANYVTKVAEKDNGKMRGVGGKDRDFRHPHGGLRREEPPWPGRQAGIFHRGIGSGVRCGEIFCPEVGSCSRTGTIVDRPDLRRVPAQGGHGQRGRFLGRPRPALLHAGRPARIHRQSGSRLRRPDACGS